MMPKKRRIMIIVIVIAVILLILVTTFVLVYLNTDMFKPKETLFLKYLGQTIENLSEVQQIGQATEFDNQLQNNSYQEEMEVKVNYTENIGTTAESTNSSINQLKLTINGESDQAQQYHYRDIQLLNGENQTMEVEYLQNQQTYGLRFTDLFNQYLLVENTNLKELFRNAGYSEEQLQNIPDTMPIDQKIFDELTFSPEEIETLKEKYQTVISQDMGNATVEKQSNQIITIHQENITTNAYVLTLTKEQLNTIYLSLLETLKEDEVILGKIENFQNRINELASPFSTTVSYKEDFVQKIEELISQINQTNIGNDETRVIVYETEGKNVRTTIQGVGYEVTIDSIISEEEQFVEMNYAESEQPIYQIILNNHLDNFVLTFQDAREENAKTITIEENRKIVDQECTKNIRATYELGNAKLEANVTQKQMLIEGLQNQVVLEGNNYIQLDSLEQNDLQNILSQVEEGLTQKIEEVKQEIRIEEIQTMLKSMEILKEEQKLESEGVSETEKTRFNATYELLQGENLSGDTIIQAINTIQGNISNMQVVSNSELKLEISDGQGNQEIVETLKKFIEEKRTWTYNLKVEYDEEGLAKYLNLTIVED